MLDMLEAAVDTDADVTIATVQPTRDTAAFRQIRGLLDRLGLGVDDDIELFVTARDADGRLISCLGLAGSVLKCAGCDPDAQGGGVLRRVMERMNYEALDRGRGHLFAYTKPANRAIFESLGFSFLAEVPGVAVLLENTPFGLPRYLRDLSDLYLEGDRVGAVVLNANPFTLGHRYLVETALGRVDALHVFVVSEDASLFPARDRYHLVRAGVAELGSERVQVHRGGRYVVSRATFPNYFIKGGEERARAAAGLDLQLFRDFIGPTLGVTDRFVGTEPLSPVTNAYNAEMHHWLEDAPSAHPPIRVHEIERRTLGEAVISASRVRACLESRDLAAIERMVPRPTYEYIKANFFAEKSRTTKE
nr:[citrate (pro-3S)-lyase] ligase [Propionibacterium sp.]